ncbi:MAG: glycine--tRNA ligase subunit beta [Bacillota bacterium]
MSEEIRDAVFEIGTAEIPAAYIPGAMEQMGTILEEHLQGAALEVGDVTVWATPRRLVAYLTAVPPRGAETSEEVRGPSEAVAFSGCEPTKAAEGFARSQGVDVADLVVRDDEKGRYVYAQKTDPGRDAAEILAEVFPAVVASLHFPRTMRWGTGEHSFVRPIRWIVALLGDDVIRLTVAGIESGRISSGPRFSPGHAAIARAEDFVATVEGTGIVLDPAKRCRIIAESGRALVEEIGAEPVMPKGLLREVCHLVENPVVLVGNIPEEFMEVPRVVVETAMMQHLRFFPVASPGGELIPRFLSVINGTESMIPTIQPGNELVLNSRLADARFFWQEDAKRSLEDYATELDSVVFHEGLGSLADRTRRMGRLVEDLVGAGFLNAEERGQLLRAVALAKADLVTLMVNEFPDLQGLMGEEYARLWGEPEEVCRAIGEQYLPAGSGDDLPESRLGRWLALIDKIDHLVGGFRESLVGSGSEDPYGMRRTATGIVRILGQMDAVALGDVLLPALRVHDCAGDAALQAEIREYLTRRLARILRDSGFRPEVVSAVLAREWDLVPDVWQRADAVSEFLRRPESEDLLVAWRRCRNLAAEAEPIEVLDPGAFETEEERQLVRSLLEFESEASPLLEAGEYGEFFRRAIELRRPVDEFLDSVMVMVADERVRSARLGLLARIDRLLSVPAEWSEIPG